ncbi:glycosyltransferase family 4 protein [Massilia sp. PAMC28688]|nr:glycosyltransferase family 4 protein [Massilia sp. PAMC28688]
MFVVTEDWYFCSHRLPLAIAARTAGYHVTLAARMSEHGELVRSHGIDVVPWQVERGSTNPFGELLALYRLWNIYRRVQPDLLHQVALKPALYGSFLARLSGRAVVVNALGGMGSVFTSASRSKALLKRALTFSFRWLLSGDRKRLILQNEDDAALFEQVARLPRTGIRIIRGAGVNLAHFSVQPEPAGLPLVVLPARLLWDKGIGEYVEAARILRRRGVTARFAIAGRIDRDNPTGIAPELVQGWVEEGVVEWFGLRNDMPALLSAANIVCLPSYREGLPKALLEAAACARAIITTDVPGCREVVRHGENGLLVPVRDAGALADALGQLLESPSQRSAMGAAGRRMAEQEFSEGGVIEQTLAIYRELQVYPLAAGTMVTGTP